MSGGDWKELFNAACAGDLALVEYHVKAGVDINYAHPEFLATPLVASILARQEAVALFLLESGANPHLASEFDHATPMQAARRVGLSRVEDELVRRGAAPPETAATAAAGVAQPADRGWFRRLWRRGRRAG